MPPTSITTLTPSAVQHNLQNNGLDALGLGGVSLSTRWDTSAPTYDANALTLNVTALHAPFRGIREFAFSPAASRLASALSDSAMTLQLLAGQGSRFPAPTAGGDVLLDLSSASGAQQEIVACTARSGDTLTITRGAQGTAKQAFGAGSAVSLRLGSGARTDAFSGADGQPLSGPSTILRLHPQAALRLETLVAWRHAGAGNPAILPVPHAVLVRGAAGFTTTRWFEADDAMTGISGAVSFHDARGRILDPVYVAALFDDLRVALGGLVWKNSTSPAASPGGIAAIATLATGTLIHCVDLHGGVYQPAFAGATLITKNGAGTNTGAVPASGLVNLAAGDGIDTAGTDGGRLRWGFATNGVLGTTRLVPPTLPAVGAPPPNLPRQFYQVAVVDTNWALLGNRMGASVLGIGPDDGLIPADVLPVVRDNIAINYLTEGPDVLRQADLVLTRPAQSMILAVSPVLDLLMSVPTVTDVNPHWPAFPSPNSGAAFPNPPASPADGISAAWTAGNDVVVTIAADKAPPGAHIRIYPRQFVLIPAITAEPSFVRGDGGASLALAGVATTILLPNPFQLASGQARPNPANLTMDIVVAPRTGTRRLTAHVAVAVAPGPAAPPVSPFAGTNPVSLMSPIFESVAPVPLFGIPTTFAPPGAAPPGGVIGFVRALASETSPRQGPRLPTMARFETILATGTVGVAPAPPILWEAVLSGGRWASETRSALHASGNPGNPAGPDVHASGIHVSGALAYDLARHAMRRAQPIVPLGAATSGWIVGMAGDNFNLPVDSNTALTGVGVLLETVAAICETPELSALTPPAPRTTAQQGVNAIANALGVTPPTLTIHNEKRLQVEVRREFVVSANGLRDAMWSLRRALREARELIYIESPQFAHTGTGATVDLVAEIIAGLSAHPNLKVIVCTPRESDFAPKYRGWSRQHFRARLQAANDLQSAAPDRVATFHPIGFPGRPAFIRTTCVFVDDVWCLSGATHFRRRGLTFDGSASIASFDRQLERGYSKQVRAFRRNLMAAKLGVAAPNGTSASAEWISLGHTASSFELVKRWLNEGGLGRIQPLWPGPLDTTILPATDDIADPDGSNGSNGASFVTAFASLLAEAGD